MLTFTSFPHFFLFLRVSQSWIALPCHQAQGTLSVSEPQPMPFPAGSPCREGLPTLSQIPFSSRFQSGRQDQEQSEWVSPGPEELLPSQNRAWVGMAQFVSCYYPRSLATLSFPLLVTPKPTALHSGLWGCQAGVLNPLSTAPGSWC